MKSRAGVAKFPSDDEEVFVTTKKINDFLAQKYGLTEPYFCDFNT